MSDSETHTSSATASQPVNQSRTMPHLVGLRKESCLSSRLCKRFSSDSLGPLEAFCEKTGSGRDPPDTTAFLLERNTDSGCRGPSKEPLSGALWSGGRGWLLYLAFGRLPRAPRASSVARVPCPGWRGEVSARTRCHNLCATLSVPVGLLQPV